MIPAKEVQHILAHVGAVQAVEVEARGEHQVPESGGRKAFCLQAVQGQFLGRLAHAGPGGLVPGEFVSNFSSELVDALSVPKQGRHTEVPDIDHFQSHLFHVGFLLFPPLVAVVLDQFTAFDPRGAVPLEILRDPVFVYPGVHVVLHRQHIDQCLFQAFTS